MSVTFPTYGDRRSTVLLLEQPVRAILGYGSHEEELDADTDLRTIIAELDAIDAEAAATTRDKARRSALRSEVRARLVLPAPAGARCSSSVMAYVRGYGTKQQVTHAAKVLVKGTAYCLTHGKRAIENAVDSEEHRLETARFAAGELTDDELLIEARREVIRARREPVERRELARALGR